MKQNNIRGEYVVGFALLVIVAIGLLPWFSMPIYSDEVAYRIVLGRYIPDGGQITSLWGLCTQSNTQDVPLLFVPIAWFASIIDRFVSYVVFRYISIALCVLYLCSVLIYACKKSSTYAFMWMMFGFLGVAGSSIVLARPEIAQLFNIATCIFAIAICSHKSKSLKKNVGIAFVVAVTIYISMYTQPQAILFLPLSVLVIYITLRYLGVSVGRLILLIFVLAYAFAKSWFSWWNKSCNMYPLIEEYRSRMVLNLHEYITNGPEFAYAIFQRYLNAFLYINQNGYLPISDLELLDSNFIVILNFAISFSVASLLFISVLIQIKTSFNLLKFLLDKEAYSTGRGLDAIRANLFLFLLLTPALVLIVFDGQSAFYRAIFANLLLAGALVIYVANNKGALVRRVSGLVVFFIAIIFSFSFVINKYYISQRFDQGWSGSSLPLYTDFSNIYTKANDLLLKVCPDCEIGSIAVDDLTYSSFSALPKIYPITYAALQASVLNISTIDVLRLEGVRAIVARCPYVSYLNLSDQVEDSGVCAARINY